MYSIVRCAQETPVSYADTSSKKFSKYSLFCYSVYLCTKLSYSAFDHPFLRACKYLLPYFTVFGLLSIILFYTGLSPFECSTDFLRKSNEGAVGESFYFFPACTGLFINDIPVNFFGLELYRFSSFFHEPALAAYFLVTATVLTSSFSTTILTSILLAINLSFFSLTFFASNFAFIVLASFRLIIEVIATAVISANLRKMFIVWTALSSALLIEFSQLTEYFLAKLGSLNLSLQSYSRLMPKGFFLQPEPFNLRIQSVDPLGTFGHVFILSSLAWFIYFMLAIYLLVIAFSKNYYKLAYLIVASLFVVLKSPFHYLPSFIFFATLYFSSVSLAKTTVSPYSNV